MYIYTYIYIPHPSCFLASPTDNQTSNTDRMSSNHQSSLSTLKSKELSSSEMKWWLKKTMKMYLQLSLSLSFSLSLYICIYTYIYIYIYVCVYVCLYVCVSVIHHWRIRWSSFIKMNWVGFESKTTEFRPDAITQWAIRPWVQLALRANLLQLFQFHRLFTVRFHFGYCLRKSRHLF